MAQTTIKGAETLRNLSIYRLSNEADCGAPDTNESAGAAFLDSVRRDVIEAIEYAGKVPSEDDASELLHEIADAAPDVYTSTKWAEFVDLAAYQEDPSDLIDSSDMDKTASVCLYIIAERLAGRLFEIARTNDDDDED